MSRKVAFGTSQSTTSALPTSQSTSTTFRVAKPSTIQPPQFLNHNAQMNNFMNSQSSAMPNPINGNIQCNQSKKENNFQKLNKQNTMLYLHSQQSQNVLSTTACTMNTQDKSNSTSFCTSQKNIMDLTVNNNTLKNTTMNHSMLGQQNMQPLKEVQIQEIENRGPTNNQMMNDYGPSSLSNTMSFQLNNQQKKTATTKMFAKDISMRRNSQEKAHVPGSYANNSTMLMGVGAGGYCPQENMLKNRPQTSYRLATKNTFQLGHNASQSNLQSQVSFQQQPQQLYQPRCGTNVYNKENVGFLSNTQQLNSVSNLNPSATNILTQNNNINNFQKNIDQIPQIDLTCGDDYLKRKDQQLSEIERENLHVNYNYGEDIDEYQRELEQQFLTANCLTKHKVTPALRARMVDWMIEVLTNFKCDDQTFFLSVSLMDRYFKHKSDTREISDLHVIGVTTMFVASKYEDIYPLKMKMVYEKIAHKKLPMERIKNLEMDILKAINYRIPAPTSLEFLKVYLKQVLNIGKCGKSSQKDKKGESETIPVAQPSQANSESVLIEKMSLYLAKMALHDYELQGKKPSLQAVGALYVALKICEQLKKTSLITNEVVSKLVSVSKAKEEDIIEVSQRVLYLAQNFEKAFPGLENLKKTHFVNITQLL